MAESLKLGGCREQRLAVSWPDCGVIGALVLPYEEQRSKLSCRHLTFAFLKTICYSLR
jgi:hypothetical protein